VDDSQLARKADGMKFTFIVKNWWYPLSGGLPTVRKCNINRTTQTDYGTTRCASLRNTVVVGLPSQRDVTACSSGLILASTVMNCAVYWRQSRVLFHEVGVFVVL